MSKRDILYVRSVSELMDKPINYLFNLLAFIMSMGHPVDGYPVYA